jgi:chloramphenicol 3-O phosphotransferase
MTAWSTSWSSSPRGNSRIKARRVRHDVGVVTAGQIVVLNGTSSSGKTSTAKAFQELRSAAGECWVVIAIDDFMPKIPKRWVAVGAWAGSFAADGIRLDHTGDGASFHIGEQGQRVIRGYRRSVGEFGRAGVNVIVDDVTLEEHEWRDWRAALDGLPAVFVALRCDVNVATEREAARGDRVIGLARGQIDAVHRFPSYDLELDSTSTSIEELARQLDSFVP